MVAQRRSASWHLTAAGATFPLALETPQTGTWAAFRSPARLLRFDTTTGTATITLDPCGDSDDIFVDDARQRVYVVCGSGHLDVWEKRGLQYIMLARIAPRSGARTDLFVPELDRMFIAARAGAGQRTGADTSRITANRSSS